MLCLLNLWMKCSTPVLYPAAAAAAIARRSPALFGGFRVPNRIAFIYFTFIIWERSRYARLFNFILLLVKICLKLSTDNVFVTLCFRVCYIHMYALNRSLRALWVCLLVGLFLRAIHYLCTFETTETTMTKLKCCKLQDGLWKLQSIDSIHFFPIRLWHLLYFWSS